MAQITCASCSYLQKHGVPETLNDLPAHLAVNYFSSQTGRNMDFEFVIDGKVQTMALKGQLAVNDVDAYVASAEAGYGLIQLPRFHVAAQLVAGSMQEVLPGMRPPPMPVSILYPHHRQLSPRVRVFVEWLTELMEAHADKFRA